MSELNKIGHRNAHKTSFRYGFGKNGPSGSSSLLRGVTEFLFLRSAFGDRGSTVVKVPYYKSEGRWFDPSWCQWIFY